MSKTPTSFLVVSGSHTGPDHQMDDQPEAEDDAGNNSHRHSKNPVQQPYTYYCHQQKKTHKTPVKRLSVVAGGEAETGEQLQTVNQIQQVEHDIIVKVIYLQPFVAQPIEYGSRAGNLCSQYRVMDDMSMKKTGTFPLKKM